MLKQLLFAISFALSASAFAQVRDDADLFSSKAESTAQAIINSLRTETNPAKTILVRTVKSGGANPEQLAEQSFRDSRVNGVQIFISSEPRKLIVTVGRETEGRYNDSANVRDVMLQEFKEGRYDDGLVKGVTAVSRGLIRAFPLAINTSGNRAVSPVVTDVPSSNSGTSWLWPVLIIGALVFFFLSRRSTGIDRTQGQRGSPNYQPQPQQGAGGGWGSSILGGLGGALAGNWLYDRLTGSGSSYDAHASSHNPPSQDSYHDTSNDFGDVGSSASGDWGGSDSGGGFDGGGDSGGGDW